MISTRLRQSIRRAGLRTPRKAAAVPALARDETTPICRNQPSARNLLENAARTHLSGAYHPDDLTGPCVG
ncbi:MAG TPA: hypothetical protein VK249_11625 [Anaerolineales bacterium]|nr:hypothetical protein [Anaerolineales bacterium]